MVGKPVPFVAAQIRECSGVAAWEDEGLVGPGRPEWHHRYELAVLADDPLLFSEFDRQVVAEQAAAVVSVGPLAVQLEGRFAG